VATLLSQIRQPIGSFKGVGAYDKDKVRPELTKRGIKQVILPQHNAVVSKTGLTHLRSRDNAIKIIALAGRTTWKVDIINEAKQKQ